MATEIKNTQTHEDLVKSVVLRTLKSRVEEINQKINEISASMEYFEKKHAMKTKEFHTKFTSGKLGDDMDFFEWKASAELYNELKEEKKVLSIG